MALSFPVVAIIVICVLPFIINFVFRLNDFFGLFLGFRYLAISAVASLIFGAVVPGASTYKTNINNELEKIMALTSSERNMTWIIDFISSIMTYFILYYCISQLAKPTQNYNAVFLFTSGIAIQYVFPFIFYIILPILAKNEKFAEAIKNNKMDEKYLSEEYITKSLRKTISQLTYDVGVCLIMLFYQKKLISRGICYLNFFLPKLVMLLVICFGMTFLDKFVNFANIIPFACGIFYYFKFVGNGQLTNKFKDDGDTE